MLFVLFLLPANAGIARHLLIKANKPNICNACQVIDDKNISIIASTCNGTDGKILGMSGTGIGVLSFTWYNSNNNIVGTQADLTNVPPGTYKVLLRDESKCLAVEKDGYIVPAIDQVVINNGKTIIKSPDCSQTNGSITNIGITNAVSYQWIDEGRGIIATTADLIQVGAGTFTLIATNKEGCSAQSTYHINGSGSYPQISKVDTINGKCGEIKKLNITFNVTDKDPLYHYFVQDPGGVQIQVGIIAYSPDQPTNITVALKPNIKYNLIVTDPKSCATVVGTYLVSPSEFYVDTSQVTVRNDACGNHTGAIVNLHTVGATANPHGTQYKWYDENGSLVGQSLELTGISAGTYTVIAQDPAGCSDYKKFTVKDSTVNATAPVVKNINLCLPGSALISVDNVDGKGGFKLYDANNVFISKDSIGQFSVNVKQTTGYFLTHTIGKCESPQTPVTVNVALPNVIIPNTFTPNNDGINDLWIIKGLEQFPDVTVEIFNRYGQLVFQSTGYGKPFDGLFNGKKLPNGTYYYTLDVHKSVCMGKVSGSLTMIR